MNEKLIESARRAYISALGMDPDNAVIIVAGASGEDVIAEDAIDARHGFILPLLIEVAGRQLRAVRMRAADQLGDEFSQVAFDGAKKMIGRRDAEQN